MTPNCVCPITMEGRAIKNGRSRCRSTIASASTLVLVYSATWTSRRRDVLMNDALRCSSTTVSSTYKEKSLQLRCSESCCNNGFCTFDVRLTSGTNGKKRCVRRCVNDVSEVAQSIAVHTKVRHAAADHTQALLLRFLSPRNGLVNASSALQRGQDHAPGPMRQVFQRVGLRGVLPQWHLQ